MMYAVAIKTGGCYFFFDMAGITSLHGEEIGSGGESNRVIIARNVHSKMTRCAICLEVIIVREINIFMVFFSLWPGDCSVQPGVALSAVL